jgi:Holliday junction resolvasome RuvABC DNA-binding subunit
MRTITFCAALALSGCVTIPSKVIEIGPNTYSLNMTGAGFATQGNTNIKALSAASDYCAALHKHLVVQQRTENGVYGFSPRQSTLTFQCLDQAT